MYIYIYIYIERDIYIYIYIQTYQCMYVYIYVCTYIYIYIHTYTYLRALLAAEVVPELRLEDLMACKILRICVSALKYETLRNVVLCYVNVEI